MSRLRPVAALLLLALSALSSCEKANTVVPADVVVASEIWQRGLALTPPESESEQHALARELGVEYKAVHGVVAYASVDLGEFALAQKMPSTMGWAQASAIIRAAAKKEGVELSPQQTERVGALAASIAETMAHPYEAAFRSPRR